jgi:hypothetical protein
VLVRASVDFLVFSQITANNKTHQKEIEREKRERERFKKK